MNILLGFIMLLSFNILAEDPVEDTRDCYTKANDVHYATYDRAPTEDEHTVMIENCEPKLEEESEEYLDN